MAAPSKVWVCGRSFDGVAASNSSESMNVSFMSVLHVVGQRSVGRVDHVSRGVPPNVMYLSLF